MTDAVPLDERFRDAVAAIDAGDVAGLERLLAADSRLVRDRLDTPGEWLQVQVGRALDGFFARPYLLWFVAEDPERNGRLPANVIEIIEALVAAARTQHVETLQEQLDYTLLLAAWSSVAERCGLQLALIDALVDAGAAPAANANNALVDRHIAAAEHLMARGGSLTLGSAVCLGRWREAERLFPAAERGQRQFALVLAALNGREEALRWLLSRGADVNRPSADLYSHGTPLHHAVCSGSLDAVRSLLDAGADLAATDSAWHGTPLGWAEHYVADCRPDQRAAYVAIAEVLRTWTRP